jgi:hypothetical protein
LDKKAQQEALAVCLSEGGGYCWTSNSNNGQGGGASDIRIGTNSLYARVIVAGGGGGGGTHGPDDTWISGGYGGGATGGTGATNLDQYIGGSGGTQTERGYGTLIDSADFGIGGFSNFNSGGGGGGWYGGGFGTSVTGFWVFGDTSFATPGGGGSGWIYTASTFTTWQTAKPAEAVNWLLTSDYYLNSASTIAGNASMPAPGGGTETGHSGNGYVRITILD